MNIESYIDHTILKPDAGIKDIERICTEAVKYKFFAVCINPCRIKNAAAFLKNTSVSIVAVAGFPLGANTMEIKVFEAEKALNDGADEVDMVISIGKIKDGDTNYVSGEISRLKKSCGEHILKVIVETCLLSDEEKETVCRIVMDSGADFIKTSTGFSSAGAAVEDIRLFKSIAGGQIGIKASGGIGDYETAIKMIEAGATRIGTSRSIAIIEGKIEINNKQIY